MAIKEAAKKVTKKTTSKASAPKTSVKTRTQFQSLAVEETKSPKKSLKIRKLYIIFVLVIIAFGALLYFGRGLFVAAVVNGQPISRLSIVKEAEKQSGKQALQTIVRNTLIEQEARRANITVSDQEINDEIKKVEGSLSKQGQKLEEVLKMQGMTRADLTKLIRLDKMVGKIVGKDVKVTDKDIDAFLEKNKEVLPKDQSEEQLRKTAQERLKQEMLNTKVQAWLESLQNKAKVLYFVQY